MKTEITPNHIEMKPVYPRIMKLKRKPDLLVLFLDNRSGTVLSPSESWSVGVYYTEWDMSQFEEFTGKITLWN